MQFDKNNLDQVSSPYLLQHKGNPIWWQSFSQEVLDYAKEQNKLVLISVGYATCHWCHIMAEDTFSNGTIAKELNEKYVCIKVDREERPDIDAFLMSFMTQSYGHGGWPLNVVLSPDLKPFLAFTYAGSEAKHGVASFSDILKRSEEFYDENKENLKAYVMPEVKHEEKIEQDTLLSRIEIEYDDGFGGFGTGAKFPPHSTLLFLIHYYEEFRVDSIKEMIITTLDAMSERGLHDHLQGGFFRYCVDRAWKIPHFEKMLYDQAMLLQVYSAAYKVFKEEKFKHVIYKLLKCVEETFQEEDLYYSAHDADTNHKEGQTYLWTEAQLKDMLGAQADQFLEVYTLEPFEEGYHLQRKQEKDVSQLEQQLLEIRNQRAQPFIDKKINTAWNSLLGIGFIYAFRATGDEHFLKKAKRLYTTLLENHYKEGELKHSNIQEEGFLEDYGAFFLFATYIFEEVREGKEVVEKLFKRIRKLQLADGWVETKEHSLGKVYADGFDHPIPSSISLAEMALLRYAILIETSYNAHTYSPSYSYDYFNLMAMKGQGLFHVVTSFKQISWDKLPLNTIQLKSKAFKDCYKGSCREFENQKQLEEYFTQFS